MLTKEELLQKGISAEVADEIIAAAASDEGSENSLQALEKAISNPEEGELFKAKGGKEKGEDEDEDDEDSDYDESYMKKYMKRYMKENKKACGKMAKEAGIFSGNMEKAVSDLDMDAEGAIIEMADLKPVLEAQGEVNSKMAKAIETLTEQVMYLSEQQDKSFDLMTKAAAVQVETAKGLGEFLSVPQGRKGVTASVEMQKASQVTPEMSKMIYSKLMKAVQSGNKDAGMVISAFESSGKNINRLNPAHRAFITQLMQEGK